MEREEALKALQAAVKKFKGQRDYTFPLKCATEAWTIGNYDEVPVILRRIGA